MVLSGCRRRAGAGRHRLGLCVENSPESCGQQPTHCPFSPSPPLSLSVSLTHAHPHPPTQPASQPPTHTHPHTPIQHKWCSPGDFPGCPGVKTPCFQGPQVPSLVRELRSHIPHGKTEKKKKKKACVQMMKSFHLPNPVLQSFVYTGITHWTSSF